MRRSLTAWAKELVEAILLVDGNVKWQDREGMRNVVAVLLVGVGTYKEKRLVMWGEKVLLYLMSLKASWTWLGGKVSASNRITTTAITDA